MMKKIMKRKGKTSNNKEIMLEGKDKLEKLKKLINLRKSFKARNLSHLWKINSRKKKMNKMKMNKNSDLIIYFLLLIIYY